MKLIIDKWPNVLIQKMPVILFPADDNALTIIDFMYFIHSVAASPAFKVLESIPAVNGRRWGYTYFREPLRLLTICTHIVTPSANLELPVSYTVLVFKLWEEAAVPEVNPSMQTSHLENHGSDLNWQPSRCEVISPLQCYSPDNINQSVNQI